MRALARTRSLAQKELAQLARVGQPTMAEMLVRMERDGVVQRRTMPTLDESAALPACCHAASLTDHGWTALSAGHTPGRSVMINKGPARPLARRSAMGWC